MRHFVQYVSCIGERLLRLEDIVEVLPMLTLDRLGQEGGALFAGLLHYRGDAVPVFSLTANAPMPGPEGYILVTRVHGRKAGLLAHDVVGVVSLDESACTEMPGGGGHRIAGAHVDGRFLRIVRPETTCK